MQSLADKAILASRRVNWYVERGCVGLAILLVLDVWLGVITRYILPFNWTFTEELARYLMIWMALISISSGISHREHIGVLIVFERFPQVCVSGLSLFSTSSHSAFSRSYFFMAWAWLTVVLAGTP